MNNILIMHGWMMDGLSRHFSEIFEQETAMG